jgi:GTP-binding protein EngB required for normal cell division
MKKLILASLALLLICSAIPVMAGEKSIDSQEPAMFQALSKLSGPGQVVLNKMSDEQLSKVEGARWGVNIQKNISKVNANNFVACIVCSVGSAVTVVQVNSN